MTTNDHRQVAAELLALAQQMEQILKDYCRLLAAHDEGHWLELEDNEEQF